MLVDAEDLPKLQQYGWCATWQYTGWYAQTERNGERFYLHRLVAGAKPGQLTDHINGNTLDNRKANLRIVTRAQNNQNRGKAKKNRTGYKGVDLRKSGKYRAMIGHDGKSFHIGLFDTAEEAARAYDAAAVRLHGEFARLNFPLEERALCPQLEERSA